MPMPEPLDWKLIDRYLAGEASPAEVAEVHARTQADPAWAQALEMLRSDFATGTPRPWDASLAWTRVRPRLETSPDIPNTQRPSLRALAPVRNTSTRWRIAAGVLVVAGSL